MPPAGTAPPAHLTRTLADASPAFARKPIPVTPDMSTFQRLILALADATPTFVPDFDGHPPRTGPRPWYRHPALLLATLGILLGIAATALAVLPGHPVSGSTPTTVLPTTPMSGPPETSGPAVTAPPVETIPTAPGAPSTTTITATQTTTATVTETTPTVTATQGTTVTTTATATETEPPVTQTQCFNGGTAVAPSSCPDPGRALN